MLRFRIADRKQRAAMMKESFILRETFDARPTAIFDAWLDSGMHGQMTGGAASCSTAVGESFSAWDGYITGTNVELIQGKKIVQQWRTSEFDDRDEDSILTIELYPLPNGKTQLTLTHTHIPEGQTQYRQGWIDHYFIPMKAFFANHLRASR